ncbi:hypothetical protein MNBD_DELTA04-554 [hydrothermal vent metagenome]|uniref:Transposase IS200-like domain-containing protein n=1 Tax=hydrothermal vent metagenome TaxID=652676 RepID=A0A3B0V393_9ZZZZ
MLRMGVLYVLGNHLHLLIRTGGRPLSDLMRKIFSGYAISFNRRHKRHGYLFQNRYKLILRQEEYLLELVRYIHLNSLRAGMVRNLDELDRYHWSDISGIVSSARRKVFQGKQA